MKEEKSVEAFQMVQSSKSSIFSKLQSGVNNYCLKGYNGKANLFNNRKEEEIIWATISAVGVNAIDSLQRRREFNKFSDKIQLVFDKKPALSLFIGAMPNSIKHFWTGTGVLIKQDNGFVPTIISQKEWADVMNGHAIKISGGIEPQKYVVSQKPIESDINNLCKNYSYINLLTPVI